MTTQTTLPPAAAELERQYRNYQNVMSSPLAARVLRAVWKWPVAQLEAATHALARVAALLESNR